MADTEQSTYTVSFRPTRDFDSPLIVVRGDSKGELETAVNDAIELSDLFAAAAGSFADAFGTKETKKSPVTVSAAVVAPAEPKPIYETRPEVVTDPGEAGPYPDGTYPPCSHGSKPRRPWRSPRNGKVMLFCALDKGHPDACPTLVQNGDGTWSTYGRR